MQQCLLQRELETTQMHTKSRMDKEITEYSHHKTAYSRKYDVFQLNAPTHIKLRNDKHKAASERKIHTTWFHSHKGILKACSAIHTHVDKPGNKSKVMINMKIRTVVISHRERKGSAQRFQRVQRMFCSWAGWWIQSAVYFSVIVI